MKYKNDWFYIAAAFVKENGYYYVTGAFFVLAGFILGAVSASRYEVTEITTGSMFFGFTLVLTAVYVTVAASLILKGILSKLYLVGLVVLGIYAGRAVYFLFAFCGFAGIMNFIFFYLWIIVFTVMCVLTASVLAASPDFSACSYKSTISRIKKHLIIIAVIFAVNLIFTALLSAMFGLFADVIVIRF